MITNRLQIKYARRKDKIDRRHAMKINTQQILGLEDQIEYLTHHAKEGWALAAARTEEIDKLKKEAALTENYEHNIKVLMDEIGSLKKNIIVTEQAFSELQDAYDKKKENYITALENKFDVTEKDRIQIIKSTSEKYDALLKDAKIYVEEKKALSTKLEAQAQDHENYVKTLGRNFDRIADEKDQWEIKYDNVLRQAIELLEENKYKDLVIAKKDLAAKLAPAILMTIDKTDNIDTIKALVKVYLDD